MTGQSLWQVLPLGPTGYGDSPYQALSAFAINPNLISPELLRRDGLLTVDMLEQVRMPACEKVDFSQVAELKKKLLAEACKRFFNLPADNLLRQSYGRFVRRNAAWLDDYSCFAALKAQHDQRSWVEWPVGDLHDAGTAVDSGKMEQVRFEQFIAWRQWRSIREYANKRGIRVIGDLPLFVAHDSADVWSRRNLFRLDESGAPTVVAGVPPDYFSADGQRWGNPLYAWEVHLETGFEWWLARVRAMLEAVDCVRIDHFRGLAACWEIPAECPTAVDGRWVEAPGEALLRALSSMQDGQLPLIAEDLGVITPDVIALREKFALPGIRILQFAFGNDPMRDSFLPQSYSQNCVAYSGTHDNDTVVGWYHSEAGNDSTRDAATIEAERAAARSYFNSDGSEIHWDFIKALLGSDAGAVVLPLQDILGLGSEARMNLPGRASGSWQWRLADFSAVEALSPRMLEETRKAARGRFTPVQASA